MLGALKPMFVSTKQKQIAILAKNNPVMAFTSLSHHIDEEWLFRAYELTRKDGAVGVDKQTAEDYGRELEINLNSLLGRIRSGKYRAPAIRRVYIPKGNGSLRPLGIPTFEDKIVQRAVVMLLEPIYEQDFYACSFGFRKKRSAHMALESLRNHIMQEKGRWVFDVDLQKYFDTINHEHLRKFIARRVVDGVIRKLIDKWLKAGVLEKGRLSYLGEGTPQGGVISPLLSNIYLHYVLDDWFETEVKPRMSGRCSLTRFADDFVLVFENQNDCHRVKFVLEKRFQRFGLTLHPDKSKLIDFRFRNKKQKSDRKEMKSFDFLGFTHYWGKSRRGYEVVFRKTAKSRLARTLKVFNEHCKRCRHQPLTDQRLVLNRKLIGHYAYFGITGNSRSLRGLHYHVERIWHKWLCRRSRKSYIPWERFNHLLRIKPLATPKIYHRYT